MASLNLIAYIYLQYLEPSLPQATLAPLPPPGMPSSPQFMLLPVTWYPATWCARVTQSGPSHAHPCQTRRGPAEQGWEVGSNTSSLRKRHREG